MQAPVFLQELMTGILKDFNLAIGYLDDIIIFSRTAEEHLAHKKCFRKVKKCTAVNETQQMSSFHKGNPVLRTYTQHQML